MGAAANVETAAAGHEGATRASACYQRPARSLGQHLSRERSERLHECMCGRVGRQEDSCVGGTAKRGTYVAIDCACLAIYHSDATRPSLKSRTWGVVPGAEENARERGGRGQSVARAGLGCLGVFVNPPCGSEKSASGA